MGNLLRLTSTQLNHAANLKEKIANLEKELAAILGTAAPATKPVKKKSKMSLAVRAKIRAAQKAHWAKVKAAKK